MRKHTQNRGDDMLALWIAIIVNVAICAYNCVVVIRKINLAKNRFWTVTTSMVIVTLFGGVVWFMGIVMSIDVDSGGASYAMFSLVILELLIIPQLVGTSVLKRRRRKLLQEQQSY